MSEPKGMYAEFFKQVIGLAKENGYTELRVDVAWGNNPSHRLNWRPAVDELVDVTEIRKT